MPGGNKWATRRAYSGWIAWPVIIPSFQDGGPMERVRRRIFCCLAACALAGGAMTAAVPAASGASTACGSACFTFWAEEYGLTYVMAVPASSYQQGSIVSLGAYGNHTSEDFESE